MATHRKTAQCLTLVLCTGAMGLMTIMASGCAQKVAFIEDDSPIVRPPLKPPEVAMPMPALSSSDIQPGKAPPQFPLVPIGQSDVNTPGLMELTIPEDGASHASSSTTPAVGEKSAASQSTTSNNSSTLSSTSAPPAEKSTKAPKKLVLTGAKKSEASPDKASEKQNKTTVEGNETQTDPTQPKHAKVVVPKEEMPLAPIQDLSKSDKSTRSKLIVQEESTESVLEKKNK